MRKYLLFLNCLLALLLFSTSACRNQEKTKQQLSAEDTRFQAFKDRLVLKFWKLHPDWASTQGFHKYDHVLIIPTPERREAEIRSYKAFTKELESFPLQQLSQNNQTDYLMLQNFLAGGIWRLQEFKSYEWDPSEYNLGNSVAEILNGRYTNLNKRLQSISEKLAGSVDYYEAAIKNLRQPTLEHTQLAIAQNLGALSVFQPALADSVAKSGLPDTEKMLLQQRIETTRLAIESYVQYLQDTELPKLQRGKGRTFRIGREQFEQKFRYDIESGYTAQEVYQKAQLRKQELHKQMQQVTRQLWPKYFPDQAMPEGLTAVKQLIGRLSENHVPRDSFLTAIRSQIPALIKFVDAKNLLTQDPTKPLVVRPTPAYMQGIAIASISSPGPYDKAAPTYYNVIPLDKYTPEQAESYLREYNRYMLQILNIHEAIPGHYTQLIYSNRSPSIIKAILGNGATVEGWAVYAERMMLENGYGQNSPEMWLMWYKWNLRVTLNAILDYSVHALNMSQADALKLLTTEGFQEEAEAREKWKRATLTQVQLSSYFTGYTEIYDLREELKKDQGADFNLKAFHEQFLSFGSAPVKYIKQMMLEEN
ncbi:DUF885 domain-containing protein [Adhaeribacter rhizoryzae]|uniref:DUF885 domain-containing protein n=1 Tax=Adhaeribacter rhizoryzae TaxID=2607907 RepID=A0A5M6DS44_9BACT|nr:DUF885 domain-containing protein [Adhaeribacter rhizoryzae]KAA5548225.1 DUF885 domain-containing protein [Adhaeribacter rhizoryzae]